MVDDDHRETLLFIENEFLDNEIIDDMIIVIVVEVDDEVLVEYEDQQQPLDIDEMVECENQAILVEQLAIMLVDEVEPHHRILEVDEMVVDELEPLEVLLDEMLHTIDDEVDDEDELNDEIDASEYLSLDIKQLADITFLDELVILAEITQYTALLQMVL